MSRPLEVTSFAVIDVEATGIYPTAHDRVIEVAVVGLNPKLEIEDEYVTLLNPLRDIGRTDIHGISAADVLTAPTFDQVAGDIWSRLAGRILVGHHLRFDLGFLSAEFSRLGLTIPAMPTLCTLELAYKALTEVPSRKLGACCDAAGIRHDDAHTALGDAKATALLLAHYFNTGVLNKATYLESLNSLPTDGSSKNWPSIKPSGLLFTRQQAALQNAEERSYLARLVERTLGDDATNAREGDYLAMLDRALEDRLVSRNEADSLIKVASEWGMSRSEVLNAHRAYLASLASEALVDGVVSPIERVDLTNVCDMLDLNRATLEELLSAPPRHKLQPSDSLHGLTVCFTGELVGQINGVRITRDTAETLATKAGLVVQSGVTRKLDLLVVADPHTQSGKAKKARDYGVRIIAESAFWRAIAAAVE